MDSSDYYSSYARFETTSKKDASVLLGADSLVGDVFEIEFVTENNKRVAWLKNRFGALVGFFDEHISRELSLLEAREWKLNAILTFVAYSESPPPGLYWGEVILICYARHEEQAFDAFENFTQKIASRVAEGMRPDVDLGKQGIQQVIESDGSWSPSTYVSLPKKTGGTALIKTKRSVTEKLVEQGRKGNKGCYFLSWVVLLGAIAGIMFGLRACGVF